MIFTILITSSQYLAFWYYKAFIVIAVHKYKSLYSPNKSTKL